MAVIALEGMKFYAYHGFYPEENKIGGYFVVDVYMEADFEDAAKKDALDGTIDYEKVYNICAKAMQKTVKLIETVGLRIFEEIQALSSQLKSLKVRISKLNPPLGGAVERTFVEIEKKF